MKLSKFFSIMVLTALITVLLGSVFVINASRVRAQEPADGEAEAGAVGSGEVPDVGSFGDIVMRIGEQFELLTARTEERKVELEEKFEARRRAQLTRLEALPDDHPRKQELIDRLEERHQKIIDSIEARAVKLGTRREEILQKLEERKSLFEQKKEEVMMKRAERQQLLEQKKQDVGNKVEEKRTQMQNRVENKAYDVGIKQEQALQEKAKLQDAREVFKDRVEKIEPAKVIDAARVEGAVDYQPSNLLESIGYFLEGW